MVRVAGPSSVSDPDLLATTGKHLLLYDGVCGLCNASVKRVMDGDPAGLFWFAPLQGATAEACSQRHGRSFASDVNRVVLIVDYQSENELILERSRAVFFILPRLNSRLRHLSFLGVLPTFLLDAGYRAVAFVRYRLFGRQRACPLPSPELRSRFLD